MPVTEAGTNAIALQTLIQGGPPGARPTLLCLHGHPGSGDCMAVFTDHLSRRFRTLAPDLRGYGRSPAPGPFAMADHLTDLEALLAREQVGDVYLLGWSLGGILALELALRHPQRVRVSFWWQLRPIPAATIPGQTGPMIC